MLVRFEICGWGVGGAGVSTGGQLRPPLGLVLQGLLLSLALSTGGVDSRISQNQAEDAGENTYILALSSISPSSSGTCPQLSSLASLPMVCMWLKGVQDREVGCLCWSCWGMMRSSGVS